MKGLLIVLTAIAILVAGFAGGCSLVSVTSYLWNGARGQYADIQRFIAVVSAGVGLVAAVLLAANVGVMLAIFKRSLPRHRVLSSLIAVTDVIVAAAAFAWIVWADTWHWADWPWTGLAKAAACLQAVKGVLIWQMVGRPAAVDAADAGEP